MEPVHPAVRELSRNALPSMRNLTSRSAVEAPARCAIRLCGGDSEGRVERERGLPFGDWLPYFMDEHEVRYVERGPIGATQPAGPSMIANDALFHTVAVQATGSAAGGRS